MKASVRGGEFSAGGFAMILLVFRRSTATHSRQFQTFRSRAKISLDFWGRCNLICGSCLIKYPVISEAKYLVKGVERVMQRANARQKIPKVDRSDCLRRRKRQGVKAGSVK